MSWYQVVIVVDRLPVGSPTADGSYQVTTGPTTDVRCTYLPNIRHSCIINNNKLPKRRNGLFVQLDFVTGAFPKDCR